jgi:hypothetical protein
MTEEIDTANGGEAQETSPKEQVATAVEGQVTPQPVTEQAKAETSKALTDQQKTETKKTENDTYGFDDIFPKEVATPMDDGEKTMLSNFLKKLNHIGISRNQAKEIFQELKNYAPQNGDSPVDVEKVYNTEMAKLGDEKDTVLSSLKSFSDTMVANRVWDDAKKKAFYDTVTTADTARLFYDVIANGNLARAGNFSHATASPSQTSQFSREEQVDMYKKAFEMAKTSRTDGDIEIKRLDRLFGIK